MDNKTLDPDKVRNILEKWPSVGGEHWGAVSINVDSLRTLIEAARAWLSAQDSGMLLVPMEATAEMIRAGNGCDFPIVSDIYRAMIAAAPAQDKGE